ncbi:NAD-dependent epimerase/dehydratase family protein [Rhodococcus sp. AQ5-07]|uniref:NAD-dependent epimerase/dehydratase family protein n=1 Tax=Rhodococcus sp. AQ5-07 TaxID=2054902 RepID=UPI000DC01E15|nr:NAD-dependent epimerase/dehydratase family protein [Rhodococcus sp. AQ5-07]RAL31740.1 NAD-dependent dehydratase [Rhodococcus sp. AQ5-07]
MRVLLTGAAGFIGGHIRSALAGRGHEVIAVDAMLPSAHGAAPQTPPGIHVVDVRSPDAMAEMLRGIDVVCHQAAVVGAGVDADDAPAYASHNDFGTAVLLAAMHRTGCMRLVLGSSMVVYGDGRYRTAGGVTVIPPERTRHDLDAGMFDNRDPVTGQPLTWEAVDEDAPLRPRSTYAASKLAQENYALAWALSTGGSVTALRYHNVYGEFMPRNTPYSGVAAMFRSSLESGQAPQVFEDGKQTRDFVEVRDVAGANVAAIEKQLPGFGAFNICSGQPITIGEVANVLSDAYGGPPPAITGNYRAGDVRHVVASPVRAANELGFRANIMPADGLRDFATMALRDCEIAGPPHV